LTVLEPPVLIDEWQLAGTDLLWTLKNIVDLDPSPGRFLLTGSVEPATYGPTYPLTGRAIRLVMSPMTAVELAGTGAEATWLSRIVDGELLRPSAGRSSEFDISRLMTTGFPAGRSQADPSLFLEGYAALVAQRAGDEGRDASRLLRTLRVLAVLEGQAVADQTIWEAADINKATWKAYDDLLERTYLTGSVASVESNRLKRLTRYPKRFLVDVALAMTLADVNSSDLTADKGLAGRYLESYVAQQLRPQVGLSGGQMSHLRTSGGQHEVDFVVEIGRGLYGFEVKASQRVGTGDAKHLVWMRDELGDRFQGATYSILEATRVCLPTTSGPFR
jgi:predicted AAA+ superfamily ATPase